MSSFIALGATIIAQSIFVVTSVLSIYLILLDWTPFPAYVHSLSVQCLQDVSEPVRDAVALVTRVAHTHSFLSLALLSVFIIGSIKSARFIRPVISLTRLITLPTLRATTRVSKRALSLSASVPISVLAGSLLACEDHLSRYSFVKRVYQFFWGIVLDDVPGIIRGSSFGTTQFNLLSPLSENAWVDVHSLWNNHPYFSTIVVLHIALGVLQVTRDILSRFAPLLSEILRRVVSQIRGIVALLLTPVPVPLISVLGIVTPAVWIIFALTARISSWYGIVIETVNSVREYIAEQSVASQVGLLAAVLLVVYLVATTYQRWRVNVLAGPRSHKVGVDDVSQFNYTEVSRVFQVRNAADIQNVILAARRAGVHVCVRGKSHTMGGHTMSSGGYLIDTTFLNQMSYDAGSETVVVGAGATWGDLIRYLNPYARSPMTMQSYSSFSIGGTIGVNAHGITNDYGMVKSVIEVVVVKADGSIVTCSRDENPDLFRHVIGGYGLFGVIATLKLRTCNNVKITMESVKLTMKQFPQVYEKFLADDTVEVKLARVNVTNHHDVYLYIFRRASENATVSELSESEREMSTASRLIYRWVAPLRAMQSLRFLVEDFLERPLDWSGENDRNLLMYESAVPLASLYAPFITVNDTFILQEYFVPHDKFNDWVSATRPILQARYSKVTLLNITIRYLYKDEETALPYAQANMFAFVLYYRLHRTADADKQLRGVHEALVRETLSLGGTFYLPYRHHYSTNSLTTAYPMVKEFLMAKRIHDPDGLFSNQWYEHYAAALASEEADLSVRDDYAPVLSAPHRSPTDSDARRSQQQHVFDTPAIAGEDFEGYSAPIVPEHRDESYKAIMGDRELRRRFQQYMVTTFNVEDNRTLYGMVGRAVWNPNNRNDIDVYTELKDRLEKRALSAVYGARGIVKLIAQVGKQKKEIGGQACGILRHCGRIGKLDGYLSIGDSGKLVKTLRRDAGVSGSTYIVHDQQRAADIIERGSFFSVGQFVPYQYRLAPKIDVPSASCDLATIFMGLHHFPQAFVAPFIREVYRCLRPGGVFLLREHDARPEIMPILDIAHSVFNVVTGVPIHEEESEIRAFRTLESWREIVTSAAPFEDVMLYGLEVDDPTEDYMIAFVKPPVDMADRNTSASAVQRRLGVTSASQRRPTPTAVADALIADLHAAFQRAHGRSGGELFAHNSASSYYKLPEWMLVDLIKSLGDFLEHTPWYRYPYLRALATYWSTLATEVSFLLVNRGVGATVSGYGLTMDVIIGAVTTFFFTQLQILSVPLLLTFGTENWDEREQLLVISRSTASDTFNDMEHPAIINVRPIASASVASAAMIEVKRHYMFTDVLVYLALCSRRVHLQVVEVSGCRDDVQLTVELVPVERSNVDVSRHQQIRYLDSLPGCEVLTDYEIPGGHSSSDPYRRFIALSVDISALLEVIDCIHRHARHGLRLAQVFDVQ